jgi:hypothetical protein
VNTRRVDNCLLSLFEVHNVEVHLLPGSNQLKRRLPTMKCSEIECQPTGSRG